LFFEKINKIGKPLANLTRRKKEKTQINKLEIRKGISQDITMKYRGSLGNTSKTYIQINWKI
jgi:hypothetical protein